MSNIDLTELEPILRKPIPEIPPRKITFLDIAGFPHYENVISNIYAHYLANDDNHSLGDLFLTAFLNLIKKKRPDVFKTDWVQWSVEREFFVDGNRIDILLTETSEKSQKCIIIENKIFHQVYNPFDSYWNVNKTKDKVGVILGLKQETCEHSGFISLTHDEVAQEVKKLIGTYLEDANNEDLIFVKNLLTNLKQLNIMTSEINELIKYYDQHNHQIKKIIDVQDKVRRGYLDHIGKISEELNFPLLYSTAATYRGLQVDAPNTNMNLIFHFTKPDVLEHTFSVSLELRENYLPLKDDLREKAKELITQHNFPLLIDNHGHGHWFYLVYKAYTFEDLNYDLNNLQNIYKRDWEPFLVELKKYLILEL
ncbi:PD-(D/E)XK nuclease family protein [Leeuwenhoekiella aestuarii]|uniref:PD-(D/E)XK nuclease superfamily protein n=1 Tax=Leeuwenhoekiella aestuarii TaxID=2249426 RepID=A0A4Q0NRG7_9FLAO|nr:PD-(D/E)XK nuclease family protein [Leeuwenhoekiella aestuarii]RXG13252.1 PD-(D/E)XK nuclease superfamily protein [Leeuwenhoekiella aestuarii]